jgi:hypothetical protein
MLDYTTSSSTRKYESDEGPSNVEIDYIPISAMLKLANVISILQ